MVGRSDGPHEHAHCVPHEEIAIAFHNLDARLAVALDAFDASHGGSIRDRFRGLYVSPSDARSLLDTVGPELSPNSGAAAPAALWSPSKGTLAARLASLFGFGQFELDALLIAFAPEFDLRYERLYAYLQDDVTRKRPTVDLELSLLCANDNERLARRAAFASDSALLAQGIVCLVSDPNQVHPPLLAQYVKPDEQIVRFLLGDDGLDSRLAACCRIAQPKAIVSKLRVSAETENRVARIACDAEATSGCYWLHGPQGVGKGDAAQEMAHEAAAALLVLDAARVETSDLEGTLRLALREAWFRRAVLYVERTECWLNEPKSAALIAGILRESACATIFGATETLPTEMLGIGRPLAFPVPDTAGRAWCWRAALNASKVKLGVKTVTALAARFRLTPAQISSAVTDALLRSSERPQAADFVAAARHQSRHALASVANKIEPRATWDDIVLPADAIAQLRELCDRVDQRDRVFDDWGLGRKLSRGRGTTVLFSGGSGTGKTMAAEVIANALELELYRIDLARVVSKYIGETEKNLERVFAAAEKSNAILFFDEAEALFGKRSEVKDSHDRYANIEIAYLLQKMEDHEGLTILATNMADALDEAMARRLAFHVYFPFPDESARVRLWERAWPAETPVASDVDRCSLARELRLSGGGIRNVALGAAFLAAGNGSVVEAGHIRHAVRREQQKSGHVAPELRE